MLKGRWWPAAVGMMQLVASVPYLYLSLGLYFSPRFLNEDFGGGRIWAPVGFIIWFPFALPLLIGAAAGFMRTAWLLALLGALTPVFLTIALSPWQPTGIAMALFFWSSVSWDTCLVIEYFAYVLMILSAGLAVATRRQFGKGRSASEKMYSPPRWYRG